MHTMHSLFQPFIHSEEDDSSGAAQRNKYTKENKEVADLNPHEGWNLGSRFCR